MGVDVINERLKKHDEDITELKNDILSIQTENKDMIVKLAELNLLVGNICTNIQSLTSVIKWFIVTVISGMGGLIIWGIQFFINM